ncbi:hypothetical protein HDV63DRAFT_218238 [Trichoderma sp. SZMC 28014]
MGSLDNWSSDEGDGPRDKTPRSHRPSYQTPRRSMNRSKSILSNLSEMSASVAFGAPWHPNANDSDRYGYRSSDRRAPRTRTSTRDIDDDWSDEPYGDRSEEASGSDNDESQQKVKRRQHTNVDADTGAGSSSSASTRSRPIAIPRSRQNSVASTVTIPEALSARGERQGGYFPFHEDPKTRVRHSHPFYYEMKNQDIAAPTLEDVDTGADADVDLPKPKSRYELSSSTQDDSYGFLSDDEDSEPFIPASMGKYYPQVYERRQALKKGIALPALPTSSSSKPSGSKSTASKPHKRRPRPRTPVIVPRPTATTEFIPPFQLESAE